jgi:ferredoxin
MSDFVERNITDLRVKIDRSSCIASANCIKAAPKLFELDDERICQFLEPVEEEERDRIIEACSVCPVSALSVYEKDGKQIVPQKSRHQ